MDKIWFGLMAFAIIYGLYVTYASEDSSSYCDAECQANEARADAMYDIQQRSYR